MRKSPSRSNPFAGFESHRARGVSLKPPPGCEPPAPPPFDRAATLRWLQFVKTDDWWRSQMPVSQNALEEALGLPRERLYHVLAGNEPMTNVIPKLARLIPDIERRALVFPNKTGLGVKAKAIPSFLWLEPPEPPFRISRLCPESNWSLWACCQFCGFNQFVPVIMNAEPHAACYFCIKPNQHPAIGAKPVKKSLIHEALKKFY